MKRTLSNVSLYLGNIGRLFQLNSTGISEPMTESLPIQSCANRNQEYIGYVLKRGPTESSVLKKRQSD